MRRIVLIQGSLDRNTMRLCKNVEMVSVLADRKLENQSDSSFWTLLAKVYRPVARFRPSNSFSSYMPEGRMVPPGPFGSMVPPSRELAPRS